MKMIRIRSMQFVLWGLAVILCFGCSGGGGSSSGGGGGLTISGVVSDENNTVVPGATVTLRRASDNSAIASTTTSGSGSFTVSNVPASTELYLNASKTSYAGTNSDIGTLTTSLANVDLLIINAPSAKGAADAFFGSVGGTSWTDPAYTSRSWFFVLVEDSFGATYPGVFAAAAPSGPTIRYNNGSDVYVTTGPTVSTGTPNLPAVGGYHSASGVFTFILSKTTTTRTAMLPLVLGEISGAWLGPF